MPLPMIRNEVWQKKLIIALATLAAMVLMIALATSLPKPWRLLGLYWPIVGATCVLLCRWFEIALERGFSSTSLPDHATPCATGKTSFEVLPVKSLWRPVAISILTVILGLLVDAWKQPATPVALNPFRGAQLTQEQREILPDEMIQMFEVPTWQSRTQRFFLHSFPEYLKIRTGSTHQLLAYLLFMWEIVAAGVLGGFVAKLHEQQLEFEARLRNEENPAQDQ